MCDMLSDLGCRMKSIEKRSLKSTEAFIVQKKLVSFLFLKIGRT